MARLKLTPELQEIICNKIRLGCTRKYAILSSGIGQSTFYRWMEKGEKASRGKFWEFWESIKKAEAEAIASYEVELRKLAHQGNPTAIIFYLQNRAPDLWKDKRVLEHSGPGGGPIRQETHLKVNLMREIEEYTEVLRELDEDERAGGAVGQDRTTQSLDSSSSHPEAG